MGRDDELLEVLSRFEEGARLVTLTGPGGTGKTRLAIEAAASLVPEYKAGVFWVGLATLRDPRSSRRRSLRRSVPRTVSPSTSADREMLLLLDNLEQVVDCAPELSELLPSLPQPHAARDEPRAPARPGRGPVRRCRRSQSQRLPSSSAHAPGSRPTRRSLSFAASGQSAAGRRAGGRPNERAHACSRSSSASLSDSICSRAAATPTPPTDAAGHDRVVVRAALTRGAASSSPVCPSSQAAARWRLQRRSADADLDTLQSLVEKSLVRFTDGRYWMLETIREYATERLEEAERMTLRSGHAAYYLAFAEHAGADVSASLAFAGSTTSTTT